MSYYQRHREELLVKQNAYHRETREERLAYMKEYNKKYYASHKPTPTPKQIKPPKEKKLKKSKSPKQPKIVKPKNSQEPKYMFVVPTYQYPTMIRSGNFVLSFD
jgi:hypothetical protein